MAARSAIEGLSKTRQDRRDALIQKPDDRAPTATRDFDSDAPVEAKGSKKDDAEQALDMAVTDIFPALLQLHSDLFNQEFVRGRKSAETKQQTKPSQVDAQSL